MLNVDRKRWISYFNIYEVINIYEIYEELNV